MHQKITTLLRVLVMFSFVKLLMISYCLRVKNAALGAQKDAALLNVALMKGWMLVMVTLLKCQKRESEPF